MRGLSLQRQISHLLIYVNNPLLIYFKHLLHLLIVCSCYVLTFEGQFPFFLDSVVRPCAHYFITDSGFCQASVAESGRAPACIGVLMTKYEPATLHSDSIEPPNCPQVQNKDAAFWHRA
jgi:hypothetical protein